MEFDEIVQSLASCCSSIKTLLFSVTPRASSVLDEAYYVPSLLWSFYLAPSIHVFLSYLSSPKMSGRFITVTLPRVQRGLFSLGESQHLPLLHLMVSLPFWSSLSMRPPHLIFVIHLGPSLWSPHVISPPV